MLESDPPRKRKVNKDFNKKKDINYEPFEQNDIVENDEDEINDN